MSSTRRGRRRATPQTRRRSIAARERLAARAAARLVRTMAVLRSPHGCPWDREQTHESLKPYLLEEAYEALDALDRGNLDDLAGELGDVLFQCVFHAQIAAERGQFDFATSIERVIAKLVRRHPHVFRPDGRPLGAGRRRGTAKRPTAADVLVRWEAIKASEQAASGTAAHLLAGIPAALPALLRAHEIGVRVATVGFDWPAATDVVGKIEEEARELREAVGESPARAAEELGDLLFSIANLARKLGIEPEAALRAANDKFTRRFHALEDDFAAAGHSVHGASAADLDAAWRRAKSH